MQTTRSFVVVGALAFAGCGDDVLPPPMGDVYQYAVTGLHIPQNNAEAHEYSLDLNGDDTHDNQLGMVFGTLTSMGFGITGTAEEALLRGHAVMLAELQTTSFTDAEHPGLVTYLGANPDPAACEDPSQLATCGRHLAPGTSYEVVPDSASELGRGSFERGRFLARVGTLPIAIGLVPDAPLRIDLRAARVRLANMSTDGGTAVLAGGITTADVKSVLIPEAARQMTRVIAEDCDVTAPSCACPEESGARTLQGTFDSNRDCAIDAEELRTNSLVVSLTWPDLQIDGEDLLSFAIGVDLVPASFAP